jgi:D-alanyl-D-alanine carboxypeptidase
MPPEMDARVGVAHPHSLPMRKANLLLGTATAALMMLAVPAVAAPSKADRAELQRRLDDVVAAGAAGAMVEARDERGVWRSTSGVAELGTTRHVPVDGRFRAGSVTKTFVATVVLQLVDKGRLRLDDPVHKWLPGAVPDGRITVRHLLNHTSGLPDYRQTLPLPPSPEFLANRWRTWTPAELVAGVDGLPPTVDPPGSGYSYSSTGYLLLGQLIEKVTGQSYDTEIERRFIKPLKLRGTSMPGTSSRIPGPHPHGYVLIAADGGQPRPVDYRRSNPSVMGASGEMISTTADLNRFFTELLTGRLLPAHLLAEMATPGTPVATYGLGLDWHTTACGVRVYGHDGDAMSYQAWSFATRDLNRQVTIAVTPGTRRDLDDLVESVLDEVFCG